MIPQIENELLSLKSNLLELTNLVFLQVEKSHKSLIQADIELANEIIRYEKRVNGLEVNIEKACENILALYNPVAHDLRFVLSTLKIDLNLERIGDYAGSIAKIVKAKGGHFDPEIIKSLGVEQMFITSLEMLNITLESIESDDDSTALRSVFVKDDVLDNLQDNALAVVIKKITESPKDIEECLNLYVVVRKLERVGDHIKNIAEEIIFYKEAKILRHKSKKLKK